MVMTWSCYGRDRVKMRVRYGQDMVKIFSRYGQDKAKIWPRYGFVQVGIDRAEG